MGKLHKNCVKETAPWDPTVVFLSLYSTKLTRVTANESKLSVITDMSES
jgi:hypothetical protein